MNRARRLLSRSSTLTLSQYADLFSFQGNFYPTLQQTLVGEKEETPSTYAGYVQQFYRGNGVVFACMAARMLLFSQARYQWRQLTNGQPGELFGTKDLAVIEQPWPNGTTADLAARALQDVDLGGNSYVARRGDQLYRLQPDYVTVAIGDPADPSGDGPSWRARVLGYIYEEPGTSAEVFMPGEVAHWAPFPDPMRRFVGFSWLQAVLTEIMGDTSASRHKLKFFENGATPNLVVSLDPSIKQDAFLKWIEAFESKYGGGQGVRDAYKTMYLAGGAQAQVVGTDLRQLSFKETQGAGESRIAAAARIPAILVGLSEGLQASTYSNYGQAVRAFGDMTLRPLWEGFAANLQTILTVPAGAHLYYDDRDIAFLRADQKDAAEVQREEASTIRTLIDAGFLPDTIISAVRSQDWTRLKHSGLYSVQLQPPGSSTTPAGTTTPPTSNNGGAAKQPARELAELLAAFTPLN